MVRARDPLALGRRMPIAKAKIDLLTGLLAAAPDEVLRRLEMVFADARKSDLRFAEVHALAASESQLRRVVSIVFEPVAPLAMSRPEAPRIALFAPDAFRKLWRQLLKANPSLAAEAAKAALAMRGDDEAPPCLDAACLEAAALLGEEAADTPFAQALALTPVLRRNHPRLADWTRRSNAETIAAIRLAFKDALVDNENASLVFWEALFALLDEPWHILRLISAATDRPSDRYLASTELAGIGERLLADIDARMASLKRFDANRGTEGGSGEAASVLIAVQEIAEFEEWLAMKRDGPWGARIAEQKRALALSMEARLRETEPAVAAALPTQAARGLGKIVKSAPKLVADPEPLLVNKAEALLTLIEDSRSAASAGGFGALRTKVLESLEQRLDQYAEDLLNLLHAGESEEPERIVAYLEIAAQFLSLIKGPQAAQIVRRRLAAAA